MNGILVDSNVIIDIITEDPHWFNWSSETLIIHAEKYPLFINKIIYAELSLSYQRIEELETILPSHFFKRSIIPWEAAFLAGKAFQQYRKAGGVRVLPLPDFFIGAHALVDDLLLLTRDNKNYKHYFPKLQLITPN